MNMSAPLTLSAPSILRMRYPHELRPRRRAGWVYEIDILEIDISD
jgi:hypothetical protein